MFDPNKPTEIYIGTADSWYDWVPAQYLTTLNEGVGKSMAFKYSDSQGEHIAIITHDTRIRNKTVEKTMWVNIYADTYGFRPGSHLWGSEDAAKGAPGNLDKRVATVPVKWQQPV